jgi:thioredoxin type arsenate reductase
MINHRADISTAAFGAEARDARRVTWLGLGVNLALAGLKLACGLLGHSRALVADAVHSLSDSSTDLAILIGVHYWLAPPDESHPHGHGRIETLVTLGIALVLGGVAGGLAFEALRTHGEAHPPPRWIALIAALASIIVKEALYRRTIIVGRRIHSSAVVANAWHHRSDALSSIPVAVAVLGAKINPDWAFLDHIGAVVVAVFILGASWRIGWPALKQLIDAGAPARVRREIERIAMQVPEVCHIHAVRTRYIGSGIAVDLHVHVDGGLTVRRGHAVSEEVTRRLLADGPELVDVIVHVEPCEERKQRMKILFLCTGNSCRSQMAEGWARHLKSDVFDAYSAGIETHGLNPLAVKVMAEAGVDISGQRSKLVSEFNDIPFDLVVTVCGHANEHCPVFPGKTRVLHVGFDDPPKLAANAKNEAEALGHYRRVRDEIKAFVEGLPESLAKSPEGA